MISLFCKLYKNCVQSSKYGALFDGSQHHSGLTPSDKLDYNTSQNDNRCIKPFFASCTLSALFHLIVPIIFMI